MYFGWQSGTLKLPPSDWWTFIFSHFSVSLRKASMTLIEETDRNWILSLDKLVIEYIYFPIRKGVSAASISRALSDFISFTWDDLYSSASLLSAKSAFVSLGTLRTFELITLSTFGCWCPPPLISPTWIMIFLHWDKGLLLPVKVENEAWLSGGQTLSLLLS